MKQKKFINNLIKPNKTQKNHVGWVFLIKPGFLPALVFIVKNTFTERREQNKTLEFSSFKVI